MIVKHLIFGFLALFLVSADSAQAQGEWRALITGDSVAGYSVEGATKIDVSTAKSLHERGVKFLDARSNDRWQQGHIPGAISLRLAKLLELASKDEGVVFYCGGTDCKLSANACAYALSLGYENVYYFAEGYPGWKAAGHPIEKPE